MNQGSLILTLIALNSSISFAAPVTETVITAEQIIDRVIDRKNSRSEQVQVTMKVLTPSGKPREADRTFRMQASYSKSNDFKALLTFLLPIGIKSTKVLTVQEKGTTSQWIYLPSAKRVSRVNSDDDVDGVLDSDLSFSDLKSETNEDYNYTLNAGALEEYSAKMCAEPAYSITAESKVPGSSSYSKRVLSISKAKFVICGIAVYDKDKKIVKNILNQNFSNIQNMWRPLLTTISSFKDGKTLSSRTLLQYAGWKVNARLDPGIFSVNNLEQ